VRSSRVGQSKGTKIAAGSGVGYEKVLPCRTLVHP
jgi:hypothetical protein